MTRIPLALALTLLLTACSSTDRPEASPEPATPTAHDGTMKHEDMNHDGEMPADQMMYACPMHPEVKANEPGDCSKCGMALVKQEEHDHGGDPTEEHDH